MKSEREIMKWIDKCFSRILVDNHISDEDPANMNHFSADNYAKMMKLAGMEASMVYACDHNGNCYYPAKTGHMHAGLNGKDIFGETVRELRRRNILPIAYYTVIYHNDSARQLPHACLRDANGNMRNGRYQFTCPNNPDAREFFQEQLAQILTYDVAGVFIDMTYWPKVCQCESCKKLFGKPIPQTIDWNDPEWVTFQRFRERSLADFAHSLTDFCKNLRADITVTHQFSPVLHGWRHGSSSALAAACDYTSGDFYGGKLQQRLGAKVFAAYSRHLPYEFMTSRCCNLQDHTSTKSGDELFIHALTTLANGGAFFFIDAINPDGTLEKNFYTGLGQIVARLEPYKNFIARHRPRLDAEVALYFSIASGADENFNGVHLKNYDDSRTNMDMPRHCHLDEVSGTAEILTGLHVPYQIVTDSTTDLAKFKVIIINNARFMSGEECRRLREFVRAGGTLIATGKTSLSDLSGNTTGNFALADVFGVRYSGKDSGRICYLRDQTNTISANIPAPLVMAETAEVRARINMPDYPCNDPDHYASIHSNPPGKKDSDFAGVTFNRYGKGKVLYIAAGFLMRRQYSQKMYGIRLLKELLPKFVTSSRNLPDSAEITRLRSGSGDTMLMTVVNYQAELPNIPLHDVEISVNAGFIPSAIRRASDGKDCPFTIQGNCICLPIPRLENGEFFEFIR